MSTAEETLAGADEEVTRLRSSGRVDRCDEGDVRSSGCIIQQKQKQLDASAAVFHERAINEVLHIAVIQFQFPVEPFK